MAYKLEDEGYEAFVRDGAKEYEASDIEDAVNELSSRASHGDPRAKYLLVTCHGQSGPA